MDLPSGTSRDSSQNHSPSAHRRKPPKPPRRSRNSISLSRSLPTSRPPIQKVKSLKVISASPVRLKQVNRPRSLSEAPPIQTKINTQSELHPNNVNSLHQTQSKNSNANQEIVPSRSINSELTSTKSELKSKNSSIPKIEKGTYVAKERKEDIKKQLEVIVSKPEKNCQSNKSTKNTIPSNSRRLLASIESTKKLPVEDLCRHLSPYQDLVVSSRNSSSRSSYSSDNTPPPMPIKEYDLFFTSRIIKIPYFKALLKGVDLDLAWKKMSNEAQKTLWDYIRNCFTMVRLLFDLENIEIIETKKNKNQGHQTREDINHPNNQDQKTHQETKLNKVQISKSNEHPDMMLVINTAEKEKRKRGKSFHDESPKNISSQRVQFINTLSSNSLKWHICSFEQSQQTIIFPLSHYELGKKNNNIIYNDAQSQTLDTDSQTLICIVLHRGNMFKKSMIGFLYQEQVKYCEYFSRFEKILHNSTTPNFLSIKLRSSNNQDRFHHLHFYSSQHVEDLKFILNISEEFFGFKEGQLCLHKGHVEFVRSNGEPIQYYLRLFKSRLLVYSNQTRPLPKVVIPLSPNTLTNGTWSDGLPGIHIENKWKENALNCTFRLDTTEERDKWLQALLAETTFKENFRNLIRQNKLPTVSEEMAEQKSVTRKGKQSKTVPLSDFVKEGKRSAKIQKNIHARANRKRLLLKKIRGPGGVTIKDHVWRKQKFSGCFNGTELVTWLVEHRMAIDREAAVKIGENLRLCGMFDHITEEYTFQDGHLYYQFVQDALQQIKVKSISITKDKVKLKDEARKLVKVYFGSDNPSLGLQPLNFWYSQLWKNAKEADNILLGLLLLQEEGSGENLALYSNIKGEKVQLTISYVVNTLLRMNRRELKLQLNEYLKKNSNAATIDDNPKIIKKTKIKTEKISVVIWYRFPWLLEKEKKPRATFVIPSGSTVQVLLQKALSLAKKKKMLDEITLKRYPIKNMVITEVGSHTPLPNTNTINKVDNNNPQFWLIYIPRNDDNKRGIRKSMVQLIRLDMDLSSFFSFVLKLRKYNILSHTDIPCLSNWLKITKSNFLRTRHKSLKELDKALEVYSEYTRVGTQMLRNARLTCVEIGTQSSSSQIGFAFPGFDSQVFDVGRHACICPWQILCATDDLSYSGSEFTGSFKSNSPAKELMQASPDVSKLFETNVVEAKRVMHEAQLTVLHHIYLASFLRQHVKHFGEHGLSSNDIIPWSTVKSQFQGQHNCIYLNSWTHLSYIYNPTITKFFTMFQSTLVLTLPRIKYVDDNSELDQRASVHQTSPTQKKGNLYDNIRLLVKPLKFLLIFRLIMESRNNALGSLGNQVKLWLAGNVKEKDNVHSAVKELNEKIKHDTARLNVLLEGIPTINSLNAAYSARRQMDSRETLEHFLQNRPSRKSLETKRIIQPRNPS